MTKNSAFRALVIDDEPLAREELCQLLNETNEVQVLAEAANAIEGLALIKQPFVVTTVKRYSFACC